MTSFYEWDVYLGGAFFNGQQKSTMDKAKEILTSQGLKVCDPGALGIVTDLPPEKRNQDLYRKILSGNVNGIERSYSMIACIDDKDPGTYWELGFNYAHTRYLVQFRPRITFSAHGHGTDLIIAQSVHMHCKTLPDLSETLLKIGTYLKSRDEYSLRNYFYKHKNSLAPVTS